MAYGFTDEHAHVIGNLHEYVFTPLSKKEKTKMNRQKSNLDRRVDRALKAGESLGITDSQHYEPQSIQFSIGSDDNMSAAATKAAVASHQASRLGKCLG